MVPHDVVTGRDDMVCNSGGVTILYKTKRRLHDRKIEHFKALTHKMVTALLLQTMSSLPVATSNGTILKSSLLESPTCIVSTTGSINFVINF